MVRYLVFILLILNAAIVKGQTISGYVYDEANAPLEGAVAYLDGTTLSATTNAEGFFSLSAGQNLQAQLVIRSMGYKAIRINDPFSHDKPFKIVLEPESIEMEPVVVDGKTAFSRKQMLNAFREQFLGSSKAGRSCKIENEDDLRLRFDTSNNTLYAEAVKPLRITNNKLKYIITFDLIASEIRYRTKSLKPYHISGAFFGGTTFFTDVSDKGNADNHRKEAYLGSPTHFVKTVVNGDWEKQKFQLFDGSLRVNPKEYLIVTDTIGVKKITIALQEQPAKITLNKNNAQRQYPASRKQRFEVLYDKKVQSFFMYSKGVFYAAANGLFWPLHELTFGGYMGDLRMGDLLPADYRYE